MGLRKVPLTWIAPHLKGKVLSLGYPDLVMTTDDVMEVLGVIPETFTDAGVWHGVNHPLAETKEVFQFAGAELECVDIVKSRGVERIVDLNHKTLLGEFDLVID